MSTESTLSSGTLAHIRRTHCREALERAAAVHGARLDALASARLAGESQTSESQASMPRPGEIYLSRSTADFPVEWLVVDEREDLRGAHCRVLPVDEFPLVGSKDFRFPRKALGGPQVGRCEFSTWLGADRFESDLCTGALSNPDLEAVRQKLVAVDAKALKPGSRSTELVPKPSEEEVDGDPEYHQWRDRTLRRAVAALGEAPLEAPKIVPLFGAPSFRQPKASPRWTRPLAVAAMLLLTLAPVAWTVLHLMESLDTERLRVAALEGASESQAAKLASVTAEKARAGEKASRLESELADLRRAMDAGQEALKQSFETRITALNRELAQAVKSKIVENIPVLRLDSRSRSTRYSSTRSYSSFNVGGHPQVLLEIDVDDPEPYSTYEACLNGRTSSSLCLSGLTLQDGRFLRVALPIDQLSEKLTVTLKGEKRGETTELEEQYDLRIER